MREKLLKQMESELKNSNYINVLNITDELLTNKFHSKEVYLARLNCLIQLRRLDEAEQFCEHLMESKQDFYNHYFDYYVFILFELNKFHILIELYEEAKKKNRLREGNKQKLYTFYELAKQMNEIEIDKWYKQLAIAQKEQNHTLQWQIINKLQQFSKSPNKWLTSFLVDQKVHPVIKTKIIIWLQEKDL